MTMLTHWADVVLESIYCGVYEHEHNAVKKLLLRQMLNKKDVEALVFLVDSCPISRLDTIEKQEFLDYLNQYAEVKK